MILNQFFYIFLLYIYKMSEFSIIPNLNGIFIVSLFVTSLLVNRVCNKAYIPIPNFQLNLSEQNIFCMIISLSLFSLVFYMTYSSLQDLDKMKKDGVSCDVLRRWKVFYWFFMVMSCLMGLLIIFQLVISIQQMVGKKKK
jgi:hypothetical protein